MWNGCVYKHKTSGPRTKGSASSSSPSARAASGGLANSSGAYGYYPTETHRAGTTLTDAARLWEARQRLDVWLTPSAGVFNDTEGPASWLERRERLKESKKNGNGAGMPLSVASQLWATPRASPNENRGTKQKPSAVAGKHGRDLPGDAADWAQLWATPTSRDWKDGACKDANVPTNMLLGRQAAWWDGPSNGLPSQEMTKAGRCTSKDTPVLSPRFVEALMNFPIGFSDIEPIDSQRSEMRASLSKPPLPSESSPNVLAFSGDDTGAPSVRITGSSEEVVVASGWKWAGSMKDFVDLDECFGAS